MSDAREPDTSSDLHVIFGTRPVGCWTARTLVVVGHRVRAVNRSGRRHELLPETIEVRATDACEPITEASRVAPTSRKGAGAWPRRGRVWITPHAPAATANEMVAMAVETAGVAPKASGMGRLMMRVGGLFVTQARATVEMMDQFLKPFVVDAHAFERTFGLTVTPRRDGLARTVAWYRAPSD